MMNLFFDWLLPIWLTGTVICYIAGFFSFAVSEGDIFEPKTNNYSGKMSSVAKIRATKFFLRDVPLWPLTVPVFIFKGIMIFRKKYLGWKDAANAEVLDDLDNRLDSLERSINAKNSNYERAKASRKRYEDLTRSK